MDINVNWTWFLAGAGVTLAAMHFRKQARMRQFQIRGRHPAPAVYMPASGSAVVQSRHPAAPVYLPGNGAAPGGRHPAAPVYLPGNGAAPGGRHPADPVFLSQQGSTRGVAPPPPPGEDSAADGLLGGERF